MIKYMDINKINKKKNRLSNESLAILKIKEYWYKKSIIFSGYIQDQMPYLENLKKYIIFSNKYTIYSTLSKEKHKNVIFNKTFSKSKLLGFNYFIYFWPKDKSEANYQLSYLFSLIPINCQIIIVGNNKSGVKSIQNIFLDFITFKKIKNIKKCLLFLGKNKNNRNFSSKKFLKTIFWKDIIIKTFPGVFGYKGIDLGSELILSTFKYKTKGKILDLGSGSGVLGTFLGKKNKSSEITLTDIYDLAIKSSKMTSKENKINGKVIISNIYSNVNNKFNLIISNPPFHENLNINLKYILNIIKNSKKYLIYKGELRIVIGSFLNIKNIFKKNFIKYTILEKTKKHTVFQIINI